MHIKDYYMPFQYLGNRLDGYGGVIVDRLSKYNFGRRFLFCLYYFKGWV